MSEINRKSIETLQNKDYSTNPADYTPEEISMFKKYE
jgi:hypothetical protein